MRAVLSAITGQVFLWECMDVRDLTGVRDGTVKGHWAHVCPLEDSILPSSQDKEASQHTIFIKTEVCTLDWRYIWHIGSCFNQIQTCAQFLLPLLLLSYFIFLLTALGNGWRLLISLRLHVCEEAHHHLPEDSMGRVPCESGVSEQVCVTDRTLVGDHSS